jgi:hypothetical protein
MMKRRAFLGGTLSAVTVATGKAQSVTAIAQNAVIQTPPGPLVWPVVTRLQPGIRSFAGHTDTVPDIVGRIGTPPSLAIFTEGNHLMALLSDDIVGAFPSWAKSQPQYADLDLANIVVVTLPQPVVVQMIRAGGIALGNLTLDVSRKSGFYPDIVMAGPEPLRDLRKLGAIEPQARFFARNRGPALLVRKVQSARNSRPERYRTHRCADRLAGRDRSRSTRPIPRRHRGADRDICGRCRLRSGGTPFSGSARHRAPRPARNGCPRLCGRSSLKTPGDKFPARKSKQATIADRCGVRLVTEFASEFITWR